MDILELTLTTILLAVIFSLFIAAAIHGLGVLVKWIGLGQEEEALDLEMPSADEFYDDEEMVAAAIVVARARRK